MHVNISMFISMTNLCSRKLKIFFPQEKCPILTEIRISIWARDLKRKIGGGIHQLKETEEFTI